MTHITRVHVFFRLFLLLDINECDSSPCHENADCFNTKGSFSCTCKPGFDGDGVVCKGKKLNFSFLGVPTTTTTGVRGGRRGGGLWLLMCLELHHQKKRIQENINEGK